MQVVQVFVCFYFLLNHILSTAGRSQLCKILRLDISGYTHYVKYFSINPFAPELLVTPCADPSPFYHL